jgi:S-adenosylmethionine:tRNA ribosyltransferase-isomerase
MEARVGYHIGEAESQVLVAGDDREQGQVGIGKIGSGKIGSGRIGSDKIGSGYGKSGGIEGEAVGAGGSPIDRLDFVLPTALEAKQPPEARGLTRDAVRLMVSRVGTDSVEHGRFFGLPDFLESGDLVLLNTSATLKAALKARRDDGEELVVHLSTQLPANLWSVELRRPAPSATLPFHRGRAGEVLALPAGGSLRLLTPQRMDQRQALGAEGAGAVRLWIAALELPLPLEAYLEVHGRPIRYGYVKDAWPSSYYQTVFAQDPGSAEMPSAGRAFTPELVTRLVAQGIQLAPLLLHTGVSSLEDHEPPYEEFYRVPPHTAEAVNRTRASGGRVVAVGTTAVRAIETAAQADGRVHAGQGWTDLVLGPERGLRAVDALLTGFHEPQASHLSLLEALAGRPHLEKAYAAALDGRYLWHEFGDLHLILP